MLAVSSRVREIAYGAEQAAAQEREHQEMFPPLSTSAAASSMAEAGSTLAEDEPDTDASDTESSDSEASEFPDASIVSADDLANYTPWAMQGDPYYANNAGQPSSLTEEPGRIHITERAYHRVPICRIRATSPLRGAVVSGVGLSNAPLDRRSIAARSVCSAIRGYCRQCNSGCGTTMGIDPCTARQKGGYQFRFPSPQGDRNLSCVHAFMILFAVCPLFSSVHLPDPICTGTCTWLFLLYPCMPYRCLWTGVDRYNFFHRYAFPDLLDTCLYMGQHIYIDAVM